ncbi:chondroitinase-B domain-containing protein [Flavobacterium faecale]|uniref:chondroitinase-B domain-containing protein n=1 Tax=Flavobacterium faecale TaxID=1355330 RepID=UPI003AABDE2A
MNIFATNVTVTSISQLQIEINKATAGTEIIVKNGIYTTNSQISVKDVIGIESEPIIIRSETIGGVTINGKDGFVLQGSTQYVIIKGFVFKHEAYHSLFNSASHCTFTRNVYECIKDSEAGDLSSTYLAISGSNNEVSYNTFQNKNFRGPMLSLQGSNGKIAPNNWVHHNHFKDFTTSDADNDNTAVQPGYGKFGNSRANMIIEHNLFENLSADAEGVLSAKCWDVTFRYNTVKNCLHTCLRNGQEHKVYGNYFYNSKLRFSDSNHKLYNNVFIGDNAGIILFSRLEASKPTGYSHIRPVNCFIGFNSFIKNSKAFISNGDGGSQNLKIVNNIFYECSNAVEEAGAKMDGVQFDANIVWRGDKGDHPNDGLINKDPMFEFDSKGIPSIKSNSPAIDHSKGNYEFVLDDMDGQTRSGKKDIGADELGKGNMSVDVLTVNQVGPNG